MGAPTLPVSEWTVHPVLPGEVAQIEAEKPSCNQRSPSWLRGLARNQVADRSVIKSLLVEPIVEA
jgi:hypothetical protein